MKYILSHTIKNEIKYASKVLDKLNWFNENNYKIKLPKGIKPGDNKKTIEKTVANEFQTANKSFQKLKPKIEQILSQNKTTIEKFFSNFNYKVPNKLIVNFTIYGPGGSYSTPNKMIIMLKNNPQQIVKTIIHETIHLIIEEPFIKKFNISHWEKEFIVDELCKNPILKKLYPNYKRQKQSKKPNPIIIKKLKFKSFSI